MVEIGSENFKTEVVEAKKMVVVDFWAPWCMPCKIIAPAVEKIAEEMKDWVKVGKTNVDDHPDLANALSVLNIPTLIFFKEGKEVSRLIGVNSKDAIEAKIKTLIA